MAEMPSLAKLLKIKPRRPLDNAIDTGYMESDRDFVLNNLDPCVKFLEGVLANKLKAKEDNDG